VAQSNYWFEIAQYDLETAEAMLRSKRYLYVGFMCHQCIEKMLKGIYVRQNNEVPPRIHNLGRLLKLVGLSDDIPEQFMNHILILNPLNISARYPDYKLELLKEIDQDYGKMLVTETGRLFEWLKTKF
jgi:HEPN domain-containing protein